MPPLDPVEARFLSSLTADPDDDATRLIYADWLEEHGSLGRASFLRAQLALSKLAVDDPQFSSVAQALQALVPQTDGAWRLQVAQRPLENCSFVVKCPSRWEQLRPTKKDAVRHCESCKRDVFFCTTIGDIRLHSQRGDCVAIDVAVPRFPGDTAPQMIVAPGIVAVPHHDFNNSPIPRPPVAPSPKETNDGKPGVWSRLRKLFGG